MSWLLGELYVQLELVLCWMYVVVVVGHQMYFFFEATGCFSCPPARVWVVRRPPSLRWSLYTILVDVVMGSPCGSGIL